MRRIALHVLAPSLLLVTSYAVVATADSRAASADPIDAVVGVISAGGTHTCGVTTSGAAQCWGSNGSGRMGTGSTTSSAVPTQVSGLTSGVTVISAGVDHSCAVVSGGARCWGLNSSGQLGNGSTTSTTTPVQVSGLTSGVTAISVGASHTCAVVSGGVRCWGLNSSGQLGNGSTSRSSTPVQVSGLTSGVTAISTGFAQSCAVVSGGAQCWGANSNGQLGNGSTTSSSTPVPVSGLTSGVTGIAAGGGHSCAVVSGGAQCWGSNAAGLLGNDSTLPSSTPVAVAGLDSGVTAISAGIGHSCAIVSGGAMCWGSNGSGRLGDNTMTPSRVPVQVSGLTSGVTAISAGNDHSCAVVRSGAARCWGSNGSGRLGNGSTTVSSVPTQVSGLTSGAAGVSAGSWKACGVVSGTARCWGENTSGQLGNGTTDQAMVPVEVSGLSSGVTDVSAGSGHSCAVVSGAAMCWGSNGAGQLGNDSTTSSRTPVPVSGLESGVTAISVGTAHSCAVVSGAALCWGANGAGRLGNDSTTTSSSPVPVPVSGLTSGVTKVSAGTAHSCAVVSGAAMCWGANSDGRLGNDSTTSSMVPVPVSGLTSGVADISAGDLHSCAVVSGAAMCWGFNGPGRLGNGSTAQSNVPVQVSGLTSDVTDVSAGNGHSCAVVSGAATCWGRGVDSQLGHGSTTQSLVPVPVSDATAGVSAISAGLDHSCAVVSGAIRCWGNNANGQGGVVNTLVPGEVSGSSTFGPLVANRAPVAVPQSVTAPRGVATHVVLTGTDSDDDELTFQIDTAPTKGVLDCNGSFGEDCTYRAGPGQTGSDSFTFTADDGTADSNVAMVSITITNQAPVADAVAASVPRGVATEIVLTGSDPNSDPFTFATASEPAKGTVSCTAAGVCTYTANAGTSGVDTFTHTTFDGEHTSSPGTVTVSITNEAPVADARSLDAGRGVATPVVLSGSDPNGDTVTFSIVDQPAKGTVSCDPSGSSACTYTSATSATGTDSFTFVANDGDVDSAPVTVSITLVNAGPGANDQAVSAPRGVATPIVLSGADPEADELSFTVVGEPSKGNLGCTGGECTYTAGPGATGTDSFAFTATDGVATSSVGTVTITITNQAPAASAQTLVANAPLTATPVTLAASDPNGDDLAFSITDQPTKGSVSCTGGDCTYTARSGATGTDSFAFSATDVDGAASTAEVTLQLDSTTPGVFVGSTNKVEPESGSGARGTVLPVTLSQPSPVALTVWYYTTSGTATDHVDYTRFGTAASPRSVSIPAGATWASISVPVRDDALVEGAETFSVHLVAATGGAVYLAPAVTEVTIRDADSIERGDPATPLLSVTSVRQLEGNAETPKARKAQVRVELSKAATSTLTVKWTTRAGTASAGTDFVAKTGTLKFAPGELEKSIDVSVVANTIQQQDRSFAIELTSADGATVHLADADGVITIADDDGPPT